jgi:hypothetical protein
MKKSIMTLFGLLCASLFIVSAFAYSPERTAVYYDVYGNRVYGDGIYYGRDGWLYYTPNCYYYDTYKNRVAAAGEKVYYYDARKRLSPCQERLYYYDRYGNQISTDNPYEYYYYDARGNLIAGSRPTYYYYDSYGNLVVDTYYASKGGYWYKGRWYRY